MLTNPHNLTRGLLMVSCLLLFTPLWAQTCSEALEQAQMEYDQGRISQALSSLSACDGSSDINEQWKYHRLKAMCHLANNEDEEARRSAARMLEINPKYKGKPYSDPGALIDLISSITVFPKFSLGLALSLGSNSSFPRIITPRALGDFSKKYTGRSNFQLGFSTSYQINRSLGLQSGLFISPKSYQMDYAVKDWDFVSKETLTYLQIPLMLRYYPYFNQRLRPYVQLGFYGSNLLKADHSLQGDNRATEEHIELLHTTSIDRRRSFDLGGIFGVGANYKLGEGHISVHVNYHYSPVNINNDDNHYDNNDIMYTYYYLEDDLSLSYFNLGIGYSLYINYKVQN